MELLLRRRGPRLRDWRDTKRSASGSERSRDRPARERRLPGKGDSLTTWAALATAEAARDEASLTCSARTGGELHTDIGSGRSTDSGTRSASPPSTTTGAAAKLELRQAAISASATGAPPAIRLPFEGAWLYGVPDPPADEVPRRRPGRPNSTPAPPQLLRPPTAPSPLAEPHARWLFAAE